MKNWLTQLKRNVISCAPTTDMGEIAWLNEIANKTFEQLADSGSAKMKRLDLVLSRLVANCIHKSGESLSEDVFLADRDASDKNDTLGGRQMIWMIMSFFKTHGSMVEQYSYEDLKDVPWLGYARIVDVWANYRLIKSAILD